MYVSAFAEKFHFASSHWRPETSRVDVLYERKFPSILFVPDSLKIRLLKTPGLCETMSNKLNIFFKKVKNDVFIIMISKHNSDLTSDSA